MGVCVLVSGDNFRRVDPGVGLVSVAMWVVMMMMMMAGTQFERPASSANCSIQELDCACTHTHTQKVEKFIHS